MDPLISSQTAATLPPPITPTPHLRAICTFITNDEFVVGAEVLAFSLRQVKTTYPLYILITPNVTQPARQRLAASGYHLILIAPLPHGNVNNHVQSWVDVGYTKLRIWQLTQFERLLYIDADCLVHTNVDHLLSDHMNGITFAAAPDTFPPDHFNAGVMLIRPSAHIFAAMVRRMSYTTSYDGGDTGFLNEFFPSWYGSPNSCNGPNQITRHQLPAEDAAMTSCRAYRSGACRLTFGYNALRTMQWFTKKAPKYWQAIDPLYIIHYCSSPKPWETFEQRRGDFLEKAWYDAYDAMKQEQSSATVPPHSLAAKLPLEFIATTAGSLRPSSDCLKAAGSGQMTPFHALQTLLAANMNQMPLGEFKWSGSGHEEVEELTGDEESKSTTSSAATVTTALVPPSILSALPSPSLGSVRPIRPGIWVSLEREQRFLEVARATLQGCLLNAVETTVSPCRPCEAIPLAIHQIWLGGPVPKEYEAWLASWKRFHPSEAGWSYTLWTDDDVSKFPLCDRLTDASSAYLAAHLRALLPRCTSHAQRSDLMRLDILWTLGGLYIDTDFEALTDFSPFHLGGAWAKHVNFYTGFSNVGVVECNNGLIAAVPQHALIGKLIQSIDLPQPNSTTQKHTPMQIISTTGPGHFTRTCVQFVEDWMVKHSQPHPNSSCQPRVPPLLFLPTQVCYPLPNSMRQLRSEADKQIFLTPATFAIHHWSCSWQEKAAPTQTTTTPGQTSTGAKRSTNESTMGTTNSNTLQELAQTIQQLQASPSATSSPTTTSSGTSSSTTLPPTNSSQSSSFSSSMNPALLSKIAAFLK